jgi:hypothetical protein
MIKISGLAVSRRCAPKPPGFSLAPATQFEVVSTPSVRQRRSGGARRGDPMRRSAGRATASSLFFGSSGAREVAAKRWFTQEHSTTSKMDAAGQDVAKARTGRSG